MNPVTKIALSLIVLLACGVALIAWGSGAVSSKLGAVITGGAIVYVATALLVGLWNQK